MMRVEWQPTVVPGATHLFEEPGTLERVAILARDRFIDHLSRVAAGAQALRGPRKTMQQRRYQGTPFG
ncbi:hypothetical protein KXD96_09605 [Mycobacterium sp. SMC-2]|nr:hypothetical protein [Mycobacterium sp. SMC-2]UXA09623.1 hypothetical protein KXD96_09605 [Mycobacterium sp. SMC-2]